MWFVPHYLARAVAGDLLLMGETEEKTGGLLRLRKMPVFISLTPAQVWNAAPIPWPSVDDYVHAFKIVGDIAEIIPPRGEQPHPVSDQGGEPR